MTFPLVAKNIVRNLSDDEKRELYEGLKLIADDFMREIKQFEEGVRQL